MYHCPSRDYRFYSYNISGVADVVTCFFCGGTLGNWEPDDNPWFEHAKFFPECMFLELAKNKRNHSLKVKSCGKSIVSIFYYWDI